MNEYWAGFQSGVVAVLGVIAITVSILSYRLKWRRYDESVKRSQSSEMERTND